MDAVSSPFEAPDDDDEDGDTPTRLDPAQMAARLARMAPAELDRYEHFRRSRLTRSAVTSLVRETVPPAQRPANLEATTVAVAGLAKLYVGDLVRAARAYGSPDADTPIAPEAFLKAARDLAERLERDALFGGPLVDAASRRLDGPPVLTTDDLL